MSRTMLLSQQTVLTGLLPGPGITLACVGVSIVSAVTILTREEVASMDAKSTTFGIVLTLIAMVGPVLLLDLACNPGGRFGAAAALLCVKTQPPAWRAGHARSLHAAAGKCSTSEGRLHQELRARPRAPSIPAPSQSLYPPLPSSNPISVPLPALTAGRRAQAILAVRLVLEERLCDSMVLHPMQAHPGARRASCASGWGVTDAPHGLHLGTPRVPVTRSATEEWLVARRDAELEVGMHFLIKGKQRRRCWATRAPGAACSWPCSACRSPGCCLARTSVRPAPADASGLCHLPYGMWR